MPCHASALHAAVDMTCCEAASTGNRHSLRADFARAAGISADGRSGLNHEVADMNPEPTLLANVRLAERPERRHPHGRRRHQRDRPRPGRRRRRDGRRRRPARPAGHDRRARPSRQDADRPAVDALPGRPGPRQPHRHGTRSARRASATSGTRVEPGAPGRRRRHHRVPQPCRHRPRHLPPARGGAAGGQGRLRARRRLPDRRLPAVRSARRARNVRADGRGACDGCADVVGGIDPIVQDGDLDGQLDLLFRLAEKHGVGIDPHIHDPGRVGAA